MRRPAGRKTVVSGVCRAGGGRMIEQAALFDHLTPAEQRWWVAEMVVWIEQKMQREQAYLARRQARNISYTATDEAYERDAIYEQALLTFLQAVERRWREEEAGDGLPASSVGEGTGESEGN